MNTSEGFNRIAISLKWIACIFAAGCVLLASFAAINNWPKMDETADYLLFAFAALVPAFGGAWIIQGFAKPK